MLNPSQGMTFVPRITHPDPRMAQLLQEQIGGPDGALTRALQYFQQSLLSPHAGIREQLLQLAAEEFNHMEVLGTAVRILWGESPDINNNFFLWTQGPALTSAGGVPWSASCVSARGDKAADIRGDQVLEMKAILAYQRLAAVVRDPSVQELLGYLGERAKAHLSLLEQLFTGQPGTAWNQPVPYMFFEPKAQPQQTM